MLSELDSHAARLVTSGLAYNSRVAYTKAVSRYFEFSTHYCLNPFLLDELMVIRFIAYLARSNISLSTIKVYLSGLRAWAIASGAPTPELYTPRVRWALRSLLRSAPQPQQARPFTYAMLVAVFEVVRYSYDDLVIFVAMVLGYFACLRAAEYCPDPRVAPPLTPRDVTVVRGPVPYASIRVRTAKNHLSGFTAVVGCSGTPICPLCLLTHLISISPHPPSSPIFTFRNGTPLSRGTLALQMQHLLTLAGLPSQGITPHSLRAGAATDAAGLGAPDSRIKALGHWRSSAYQAYIRPSPSTQAAASSYLASGLGLPPSSSIPHSAR